MSTPSETASDFACAPFVPALVILSALRQELGPLLLRIRRLPVRDRARRGVRGFLGGTPIVLGSTGAGVGNAERGAHALLRHVPEGVPLLGVGLAGALSPGLGAGDLVVAESFREGTTTRHSAMAEWVRRAREAGARPATVVTLDEVITSARRKRELWQSLGRPEVAAVDMESARWASVARAQGRPFLVVRAISDEADEELPPYLAACRDASGDVDRGRVLRRLLGEPSSVGALLRLRRRLAAGAAGLADFVARFLEASPLSAGESRRTSRSELEEEAS